MDRDSGDEKASSFHPATIKADRLESEIEESRMLREKDRLRYEVKLQEAETEKGKLIRQVMIFFMHDFANTIGTSCTSNAECLSLVGVAGFRRFV